ncbi:hypothetical protein IWQ60_006987 [Tieghemiomyces parasiticus]|uniref:ZZ-type domain-containing protein n=1 Tax=Tieghemiomyces parasiticus TaxID=78921 RepID=A0A9W8A728_9FUNG|nr:hypothetical protein IWQ60_006987 [Tieghemiomyces parasiticus]
MGLPVTIKLQLNNQTRRKTFPNIHNINFYELAYLIQDLFGITEPLTLLYLNRKLRLKIVENQHDLERALLDAEYQAVNAEPSQSRVRMKLAVIIGSQLQDGHGRPSSPAGSRHSGGSDDTDDLPPTSRRPGDTDSHRKFHILSPTAEDPADVSSRPVPTSGPPEGKNAGATDTHLVPRRIPPGSPSRSRLVRIVVDENGDEQQLELSRSRDALHPSRWSTDGRADVVAQGMVHPATQEALDTLRTELQALNRSVHDISAFVRLFMYSHADAESRSQFWYDEPNGLPPRDPESQIVLCHNCRGVILGKQWACHTCSDFNLCTRCYHADKQHPHVLHLAQGTSVGSDSDTGHGGAPAVPPPPPLATPLKSAIKPTDRERDDRRVRVQSPTQGDFHVVSRLTDIAGSASDSATSLVAAADPAPEASVVHPDVFCDQCHREVRGIRYKCANCSEYNLCDACESYNVHDPNHVFLKLRRPIDPFAHSVDSSFSQLAIDPNVSRILSPPKAMPGISTSLPPSSPTVAPSLPSSSSSITPSGSGTTTATAIKTPSPSKALSSPQSPPSVGTEAPPPLPPPPPMVVRPPPPEIIISPPTRPTTAGTNSSASSLAPPLPPPPALTSPPSAPARPSPSPLTGSAAGVNGASDNRPQARWLTRSSATDHQRFVPGARIPKTWLVCNDGDTFWPITTRLVCTGGHPAVRSERAFFPVGSIRPGQTAYVTAVMYAPDRPGNYTTYWRLTPADGPAFGDTLAAYVQVAPRQPYVPDVYTASAEPLLMAGLTGTTTPTPPPGAAMPPPPSLAFSFDPATAYSLPPVDSAGSVAGPFPPPPWLQQPLPPAMSLYGSLAGNASALPLGPPMSYPPRTRPGQPFRVPPPGPTGGPLDSSLLGRRPHRYSVPNLSRLPQVSPHQSLLASAVPLEQANLSHLVPATPPLPPHLMQAPLHQSQPLLPPYPVGPPSGSHLVPETPPLPPHISQIQFQPTLPPSPSMIPGGHLVPETPPMDTHESHLRLQSPVSTHGATAPLQQASFIALPPLPPPPSMPRPPEASSEHLHHAPLTPELTSPTVPASDASPPPPRPQPLPQSPGAVTPPVPTTAVEPNLTLLQNATPLVSKLNLPDVAVALEAAANSSSPVPSDPTGVAGSVSPPPLPPLPGLPEATDPGRASHARLRMPDADEAMAAAQQIDAGQLNHQGYPKYSPSPPPMPPPPPPGAFITSAPNVSFQYEPYNTGPSSLSEMSPMAMPSPSQTMTNHHARPSPPLPPMGPYSGPNPSVLNEAHYSAASGGAASSAFTQTFPAVAPLPSSLTSPPTLASAPNDSRRIVPSDTDSFPSELSSEVLLTSNLLSLHSPTPSIEGSETAHSVILPVTMPMPTSRPQGGPAGFSFSGSVPVNQSVPISRGQPPQLPLPPHAQRSR